MQERTNVYSIYKYDEALQNVQPLLVIFEKYLKRMGGGGGRRFGGGVREPKFLLQGLDTVDFVLG